MAELFKKKIRPDDLLVWEIVDSETAVTVYRSGVPYLAVVGSEGFVRRQIKALSSNLNPPIQVERRSVSTFRVLEQDGKTIVGARVLRLFPSQKPIEADIENQG